MGSSDASGERRASEGYCKDSCWFDELRGGTSLIGAADDGSVIGIENDMKTLNRADRDGFEQALRQVLINYLGAEFSQYVAVSFVGHGERTICIVKVESSPKPVYLT